MGFLKEAKTAIKNEWTKMNGMEKAKIAIRVLCGFGSGCVCGVAARKYIESENPGMIETTAVVVTALGGTWALSETAYNAWDKTLDMYAELKRDMADDTDETEEEVG